MRERQRYGQMETEADRKTDRELYLPHAYAWTHNTPGECSPGNGDGNTALRVSKFVILFT